MKKIIITDEELKKHVASICQQIVMTGWKPDYVVGINNDGLYPALLISRYFDVRMETLRVDSNGEYSESNLWMAEDAFGYDGPRKNILMVNGFNDTGKTNSWVVDDWMAGCLPSDPSWIDVWNNNVKFSSVVNNISSNSKVDMDFSAIEVSSLEGTPEVDFPHDGWWKK